MGTLKHFLLTEELKISHADRYIRYVDVYHEQIFHDLKKNLETSWEASLKSISKEYPVHPEAKEEVLLRNPKALTQLTLSHKSEKLITSRSPTSLQVDPSIKLPLIYSLEERKLICKKLLDAADSAFKKTVDAWSEIFNYEKNGRVKPWFKLTREGEELRLQLALSEGQVESYKTLYAVRVEYGKIGSKLKDFDRLYLVNLIH